MLLRLHLTNYQKEFINSPHRYRGFFAGRRVGKSITFCLDVLVHCLRQKNYKALYLAPSNSLCREMFELLAYNAALAPVILNIKRKEPYTITFRNGSTIVFRSWSRIELLRGFKFHYLFLDEVQNFPERYYSTNVDPLVADLRGKVTVAGQFRGAKGNWFYDRFYWPGQFPYMVDKNDKPKLDKDGKVRPNLLYKSWRIPSDEGLMFRGLVGQQELERIYESTPPSVIDQEWKVIPTANVDAVFPWSEIEAATLVGEKFIDGPRRDGQGRQLCSYVMAVDIGRIVDNTCITILEVETMKVVYQRFLPLNTPYPKQAQEVFQLWTKWNKPSVILDSTGLKGAAGGRTTDPIIPAFTQLIPDAQPFVWSYSSKPHIITHLAILVRNGQIKIPAEAVELIRQMRAYTFKYKGGTLVMSAPDGDHDDAVASLCMACYAVHLNWYKKPNQTGPKITGLF